MVIQGVSYLSDFEAKKTIIETARRLESRGFMTAGDGSLSVRVGPNAVWITVDGADKAALTQDMLVRVDLNGKANLSARPKPLGDDLPIHLKIYRESENVQCVIHVYPPCAEVLSCQGQGLPAASFSPSVRRLGRMELIAGLTGEALAKTVAAQSRTDKGARRLHVLGLDPDGGVSAGRNHAVPLDGGRGAPRLRVRRLPGLRGLHRKFPVRHLSRLSGDPARPAGASPYPVRRHRADSTGPVPALLASEGGDGPRRSHPEHPRSWRSQG